MVDTIDIEEAFSAAIAENGFGDHYIPADGEWHNLKFPDNGNGSAILNANGDKISGVVRDWRKGDKATVLVWRPNGADHSRKTEKDAEKDRVRQESLVLFLGLPDATKDHPYLIKKGIKNPHPLKLDGEDLVMPIYSAASGDFQAIQRISPSGQKLFPKHSTIAGGCMMPFSSGLQYLERMHERNDSPIVLCEGYATAYSIYSATEYKTVACLSCGNLKAVAREIHRRYPRHPLIIAADDESKKEEIDWQHDPETAPGIDAAYDAAREVWCAKVALPSRKDFNDVFALDGAAEVKRQINAAVEPPPLWVSAFPVINISNWDNEPVPQQEWAVPDRIPMKKVTLFSGEGGGGKSLLQLQLSVAHVLGKQWLGTTPCQGPVIFIDAEDDEQVYHKRLADILRYYGAKFSDVAGKLHFSSLVGQEEDALLCTFNRNSGRITPTPRYFRLLEMAGDLKPVMIGIASSADVFGGNEIERSQVRQFISTLTKVARTSGGGLVLISHPSLTGISSDSGLSGSTQWHNSVRARFFIKSVRAGSDEEPDTNLREINFKKNNNGPISESIPLQYQDGLFLPIDTPLDVALKGDKAKAVFLALLRRYNSENRNASANQGPSYAPKVFAEEPEAREARVSKKDLAGAMSLLLRDRIIMQAPYGKKSDPNYRLQVSPPPGEEVF